MATAPLSLSISCSVLPPSCRTFMILHEGGHKDTILRADAHFRYVLNNIQPNRQPSHFVTVEVFSRMMSIAKTFTHLETLSLTNHIISEDFYGLLRRITRLRVLDISFCHFETESSTSHGGFVASEYLQQLTFRNITFKHRPNFSALVAAPNLSSLSFDRTSGGCLPISGLRGAYGKLVILHAYNVTSWTVEQMSPHDTIVVALAILNLSPTLKEFSTDISLHFPLTSSVPVNSSTFLETYRGPADTLAEMISRGAFQEIVTVEIASRPVDLDSLFSFVSRSVQGLQRLVVTLGKWDRRPLDALARLANLSGLTHIFFNVEDFTSVCDQSATWSMRLMGQ
jgi:hypothetical protein